MKLVEIQDQSTWDGFVAAQPWSSFTQSWAWGEFQKSQGHPIKRFFLMDDAPRAACQFIFYKKFLSGYWFAPRGPVLSSPKILSQFLEQLPAQNLQPSPLFYRFEPMIRIAPQIPNSKFQIPNSTLRRTHAMSPASTILVDLGATEDELLARMHPKTRYNIRVANKNGIIVDKDQDIEIFLELLKDTATRDQFISQPANYLRALWKFLAPLGMARIHIAKLAGKPLAANLEIIFGDTITYLHGASSSESRSVMAPYALQWASICEAKREGHRYYDLWGCNPSDVTSPYYKPSWAGITRFKQGWGGEMVDLVGTWDLPKHPFLYKLVVR